MAETQSRPSRLWLYGPFVIAAVILGGYYMLWRAGAAEMKKQVGIWVEGQRALGLDISHGPLKADGFPFFLRVHVPSPDIADPSAQWRWRSESLSLDALPYDLNRLIFSPSGEQVLSTQNLGEWRTHADDFRASIKRDKKRDWVFSVTITAAKGRRAEDAATYQLGSLVMDLAPAPEALTTLTVNLAAQDFSLAGKEKTHHLAQLQTALSLSETMALSGPAPTAMWRAADGVFHINHFFADIEETKLAIAGNLQLDENFYPAGQLKTEIIKPAGLTTLLGDAGVLSPTEAAAASAGLGLLAIASGGKITAPLEFHDGGAHIGRVKIANLPVLKVEE